MWQLHTFPLCPFSRKVRLALSEKGVTYETRRENPWDGREGFLALNPAGRTPVLHHRDKDITLIDSQAICEFLDDAVERSPLIPGNAIRRAEIRRLVALFDGNFYEDVTGPLLVEKMRKRIIAKAPPDSRRLREVMRLAAEHLEYIDWLVDSRRWLGGSRISLADYAAASHISVADYLGGIDWDGHSEAQGWYRVMKSRPSFRPLLAERMEGIHPPAHYADVNA